jgi:hypothetical protein
MGRRLSVCAAGQSLSWWTWKGPRRRRRPSGCWCWWSKHRASRCDGKEATDLCCRPEFVEVDVEGSETTTSAIRLLVLVEQT